MTTDCRRLALTLLALTLCSLLHAQNLVLVDKGASTYEIVLVKEASRPARLAATELQSFVEKATGVKLPIVGVPSPDRHHLFLGPNPESAAAGVTPDDLKAEGFHLRVIGQDVHFVGRDSNGDPSRLMSNYPVETGTLTAVYEFLERFVGVTFCWHDDLGTVIPHRETVTFTPLNLTQNPAFTYRRLAYGPQGQTDELFGRRLRLGWSYQTAHSHNWFQILPAEKYGQEHPEYYALVKGERTNHYYLGHHGGQVCTSNPAVVDLFVQAALNYFKTYPDRKMFSLSPNDGGGFCECANCRALDAGQFMESDPSLPVLTDRMLHFYNQIAERVAQVYPDKLLGAYVYSYYQYAPRREKVHPNLYLMQATNSAFGQGRGWAKEHEGEKQWRALAKHFAKYDIYYLGGPLLQVMAPVTTHAIERLKAEQAIGLEGGYLYMGQSYEQLGAGHYLMARLMWDPTADARQLEQRYYQALYGPAAADVKGYYDLLEGRLRKMMLERVDVDEPAVKQLLTHPEGMTTPGHLLAAYWPVLDQAEKLMKQAEARALDPLQKERLQRLRDHHDLLVGTVRGMVAALRLESQAAYRADDVAMLKAAVELREAAKTRLAGYAPTLPQHLAEADKDETAKVSATGAFYQLSRGAKPPTLTALQAAKPVKVDGKGDDAVWTQAPASYFLLARSASAPSLGARAKLAYDAANLYVFVEGREPDTGKLIKAATGPDNLKVFDDDCVEIFIQPPGQAYYQLALGAGGGMYDGVHPTGDPKQGDMKWSSGAQGQVAMDGTGWSAELAIPLASFGKPLSDGDWKINVYRTRRGCVEPDEYTAASPTFSGYHAPAYFAALKLAQASSQPTLAYGTLDALRPEEAVKRLHIQAQNGATVELVTDRAWCGAQALHITVPQGGLAGLTFEMKVQPQKGYRLLASHLNHAVTLNPSVRPTAPITRVIFRDDTGQAVTPTERYSWDGAPALENPDRWRTLPHVFTTPERTTQIGFTIFFHHPGEYWLDEVRLEEM